MYLSEMEPIRNQWYAIAKSDALLEANPRSVQLLGGEYVLWRPEGGAAVLHAAYCPHRGANLAAGSVAGDRLACCYHGWQYDADGVCKLVPQLGEGRPIPAKARIASFPVVERYGLFWACVGEPKTEGPPGFYEADELGWRVQVDFFEPWAATVLRIIDNNIDQSHPAFVHQGSFGDPTRPLVPDYELEMTESGFKARIPQDVAGVGPQMGAGDESARYQRYQEVELLDPVHTRIRLMYEDSAPDYAFYGSATPIDDRHSYYVRVSALEGAEEQQPYEMFWEYSRRVTLEDKVVLETTNPSFPVEITDEVHLRADKTTVAFRRQLARLLAGDPPAVVDSMVRSDQASSGADEPAA